MDKELFNKILRARPDTHFDEGFSARLRARLVEKKARPIVSPYRLTITELRYSAFGALVAVIFVAPLTFLFTKSNPAFFNDITPLVKNISSGLTPTQQISEKGSNAFGTISPLAIAAPKDMAIRSAMTSEALGVSEQASATATVEYVGDPSVFRVSQGTVLKRTTGADASDQLANLVKNASFGLTDLSSFPDLSFSTMNLKEDAEYGYALTVDFGAGEISIMPNWETWPVSTTTPVATSSASESFEIVRNFLKDHKIDVTSYNSPIIVSEGEEVVLVYPARLDSRQIYEQDGSLYGLRVSVDLKAKRVSSVLNLTSQVYESSQYALETSQDAIIAAAQALIAQQPSLAATTTIKLATPERVLMRYVQAENGAVSELYMPAFKFSIENASAIGLPSDSIVVPLVASSSVSAAR